MNFKFKSIRTKLIALVILLTGSIATFVYIYFPQKFEEQELKAIKNKVYTMAQLSSQSVASALFFDDYRALEEEAQPLINNKNIKYFVIHDNRDSLYFVDNLITANNVDYKNLGKTGISEDGLILKASVPILFRGENLGMLYAGYSLDALYREVWSMRKHIAIISIMIFILGFVSVFVMERFITRPLSEMVKTVKKVSEGNLAERTKIMTTDEIGFLANSFNKMLDNIEQTKQELETINNELEKRVQARTKELEKALKSLQKENQQRKLIQKALEESEERFRGLFENSTIGIYRSTPAGKVLMANPTLIRMLGYDSLEEIQAIEDIAVGYLDKNARNRFRKLLEEKGTILGFEEAWQRKDGTVIYIRESARVIKDNTGKVLFYEGSVEDITSKKIIEKELIEAKEKAEASSRLKSEFLAQMSHEIRTPVNSILSYTSLLQEELKDKLPEDLQISFDMINNGGRRLIRTIDMIINMSELQTGSFEIEKTNTYLIKEILNPLIGEFRTIAKSKGLYLELDNGLATEDIELHVDIYSFTQIFANLIDNAIKYTETGGITIKIQDNNRQGISIQVIDTGIGISEEFQKKIFDPFTQEEQGYTRKFEGNGLGLALVKKYTEINGCAIKIESKKGTGSRFIINIPNYIISKLEAKN